MSDKNLINPRIGKKHPWDYFSDQPAVIRDKKYKRSMRKKYLWDHVKTLLTSIIIFPLAFIFWPLVKKKKAVAKDFFSLCVNLDKGYEQIQYLEELECNSIQVRFYLSEMHMLEEYFAFLSKLRDRKIMLTIVQSQKHIDNSDLLEQDIKKVFELFSPLVSHLQVGTTINRSKWGFFSLHQYFEFYQKVQDVRDELYPDLKLLGPSVIDFEYPYVIRALFNFNKLKFDGLASLLYVDRRGAPENAQMLLFDTQKKISFLYTLACLSNKSTEHLHLTEANWPLENTAPWAPTSETECISEAAYANFMLRYYLCAMASQCVDSVHWHQLVANGYGLIDMRDGTRKREAFYVFKTMIKLLDGVEIKSYQKKHGIYHLYCMNQQKGKLIHVLWSAQRVVHLKDYKGIVKSNLANLEALDKTGNDISTDPLISDSPIYVICNL